MRWYAVIWVCLASPIWAQFTTVQTGIEVNCKDVEGIEEGDVPSVCDGYQDYQLYRYYNLYGNPIYRIEKIDFEVTMLPAESSDNHQCGTVIYWRLDNGVPFAAMMQVTLINGSLETGTEEVVGRYYVLRGLGPFPDLMMDFPVDEVSLEQAFQRCDQLYTEYLKE